MRRTCEGGKDETWVGRSAGFPTGPRGLARTCGPKGSSAPRFLHVGAFHFLAAEVLACAFSLTPALARWQRENRPPRHPRTGRGDEDRGG